MDTLKGANADFFQDFLAKRDGAIDPAAIAHKACGDASKTQFPGTDIALEALTGQAALEALSDTSVIEQRIAAANRVYAVNRETALLAIIAKLKPSANAKRLGHIRHDDLVPALKLYRDSDERLAHVSDDSLVTMAEQMQEAIAQSVNTPEVVEEQTPGMRLARLGGTDRSATAAPRR